MTFLGNAFSLQMLETFPASVSIKELAEVVLENGTISAKVDGKVVFSNTTFESAVGHADTANVLGVPCNRINVRLHEGDALVVAQLQGGRLPEGTTTLPAGFSFKFLLVTVG